MARFNFDKDSEGVSDNSEDESEVLEESPCGRWLKRRQEVKQRDIPGIDAAYLAMDAEKGMEVVWNEVFFSERKKLKKQEGKIRCTFDTLMLLDHPNIVKFHQYWIDEEPKRKRVVFITEYMSSGSVREFLKKAKSNISRWPIQAWRRWCSQILYALSYLHSCLPPIIHGNISCDTIFIQHNGLVKIGSIGPDTIQHNVKSCAEIENTKNHFAAPEYGYNKPSALTSAVDIYAFGMCALEMAALDISGSEYHGRRVTKDIIKKTIDSIENELQKDFIKKCLIKDPMNRPSARKLLFHPVIFEVHSLKLLCAHTIVKSSASNSDDLPNEVIDSRYKNKNDILAFVPKKGGLPGICLKRTAIPELELEKLLDDVRNGIYPLTSYCDTYLPVTQKRKGSSDDSNSTKANSPESAYIETRRVVNVMCNVGACPENAQNSLITLLLRMDDRMNRQLTCVVTPGDTPQSLAADLVQQGLIFSEDCQILATLMSEALGRWFSTNVSSTSHFEAH